MEIRERNLIQITICEELEILVTNDLTQAKKNGVKLTRRGKAQMIDLKSKEHLKCSFFLATSR